MSSKLEERAKKELKLDLPEGFMDLFLGAERSK